jgi:glutaredoxin-related protein
MWAGWPTFPMIFVKGTLIGGSSDMRALINSGDFNDLMS